MLFSYEEYALPLQKTFDIIVKQSLQQLRGVTLDDRVARLRKQESIVQVAKKSKKGQFAALKEDFK